MWSSKDNGSLFVQRTKADIAFEKASNELKREGKL
jgi:hypothetical protein